MPNNNILVFSNYLNKNTKMKEGFIYGLVCPIDKKIRYIGQTRQKLIRRLCKHIWHVQKKIKTQNSKFNHKENWIKKIINENLIDNLEIIEIEKCQQELLNEREIFWIRKYKNDGFNLTNQTNGGDTYYYEDKIKLISESNKILKKGNKYCSGRKHSEKTKRRISEAVKNSNHPHYGIPKPEYIRKKISKANSGEKNGMFGNHFIMSDNHKNNISKALKQSEKFQTIMKSDEFRKKISDTQINPVLLLDFEFNIFKEFKNMAECSRYLCCSPENVYNARRDKRKVKKKYWVVYPSELNDFKKQKM